MKLADLRRIAIKSGARIHFSLSNGMECVLNEHGIAQVPAMRAAGSFNLEEELARATEFRLESASAEKNKARPQILTREQMAAMMGAKSAEAAHDDHED
jgi:hypothetical protein